MSINTFDATCVTAEDVSASADFIRNHRREFASPFSRGKADGQAIRVRNIGGSRSVDIHLRVMRQLFNDRDSIARKLKTTGTLRLGIFATTGLTTRGITDKSVHFPSPPACAGQRTVMRKSNG